MTEDIFGPIVTHLQGKKFHHKVQHVEPIMVPYFPKGVLDRYNKVTLCCDLMQINVIGLLNTISWCIMFATGIMNKNRKLNNIEYVIKQVSKLYMQRGFKITCMHADS